MAGVANDAPSSVEDVPDDVKKNRKGLEIMLADPETFVDHVFAVVTNHGQNLEKDWATLMTTEIQNIFSYLPVEDLYKIPCLNIMDAAQVQAMNGKVVRFRSMVQQVYDPLLLKTLAMVKNRKTGETREICLLYKDTFSFNEDFEVISDVDTKHLRNLTEMHCMSVPGENRWVSDIDRSYQQDTELPTSSGNTISNVASLVSSMSENQKRATFCYPVPSMYQDPLCKVVRAKIYNQPDDILVGRVVDFYGILTVESAETLGNTSEQLDFDSVDDATAEGLIRNPNPSIIPSLRVLGYLKKCNFESPRVILSLGQLEELTLREDWRDVMREQLLELFVDCFMGDRVCANYVICNLLSTAVPRVGGSREIGDTIGSLPICITELPVGLSEFINSVIQALVTKSVYLEKFLENLESFTCTPWMDYRCGKLMAGVLHLSSGTYLLLDETVLTAQQQQNLTKPKALQNFQHLVHQVERNTLEYDYTFQKFEFPNDLPVVCLSTDKRPSFNSCTCIPLEPKVDLAEFESRTKPRLIKLLSDKAKMAQLRDCLLFVKKSIAFRISDELAEMMAKEMMESKLAPEPQYCMNVTEFEKAVNISKYLLKYNGKSDLTEEVWRSARSMEIERKTRLINRGMQ